jgi:hypothetical protein
MARSQDDLRLDVQRGREASLLQLSEAAQGIRGELGQAHRALAEVKALEQGRARQMDEAAHSLRRLEAVVAGSSTRGTAGENILARALSQLPADLLAVNVAFGNKIVEYALRLPGGRVLPIDSKWTSVGVLERLDASPTSRRGSQAPRRPGRARRAQPHQEMTKYLDPERTLSLGLLAVPDAVYTPRRRRMPTAIARGILVVPYSLALPYVLALYRLTLRFGCAVDTDQLADRLRALDEMRAQARRGGGGTAVTRHRAARELARGPARPSRRGPPLHATGCWRRPRREIAHRPSRRRWASSTDLTDNHPHGDAGDHRRRRPR